MSLKIEKYEKDLDALLKLANLLHMAMQYECEPEQFQEVVERKFNKKEAKKYIAASF